MLGVRGSEASILGFSMAGPCCRRCAPPSLRSDTGLVGCGWQVLHPIPSQFPPHAVTSGLFHCGADHSSWRLPWQGRQASSTLSLRALKRLTINPTLSGHATACLQSRRTNGYLARNSVAFTPCPSGYISSLLSGTCLAMLSIEGHLVSALMAWGWLRFGGSCSCKDIPRQNSKPQSPAGPNPPCRTLNTCRLVCLT